MKLIIQIPCYNEEKFLEQTIKDLPKSIERIDKIEVLVIDDGSKDNTVEVARRAGVNHIVRLTQRYGLARAFTTGLDAALNLGADIIVNTDADNQYRGEDIAKLIKPILNHQADIVIGKRDIQNIPHFSKVKKFLQKLGSWVVRKFSGSSIEDATSGFRAYNCKAAMCLHVLSDFTYTLETLIQSRHAGLTVASVPVQINKPVRQSRLFSSLAEYIRKSVTTIFRIYLMYNPLKTFSWIGCIIMSGGLILVFRFLYFYFITPGPTGKTQSLIIAGVFLLIGFQIIIFGFLADLTAKNRKLIEDILFRIKKNEFDKNKSV